MQTGPVKLLVALKNHFQLPSEDFKTFGHMVTQLEDADRVRFAELFGEAGVMIDPASILRPTAAIKTTTQL